MDNAGREGREREREPLKDEIERRTGDVALRTFYECIERGSERLTDEKLLSIILLSVINHRVCSEMACQS